MLRVGGVRADLPAAVEAAHDAAGAALGVQLEVHGELAVVLLHHQPAAQPGGAGLLVPQSEEEASWQPAPSRMAAASVLQSRPTAASSQHKRGRCVQDFPAAAMPAANASCGAASRLVQGGWPRPLTWW